VSEISPMLVMCFALFLRYDCQIKRFGHATLQKLYVLD